MRLNNWIGSKSSVVTGEPNQTGLSHLVVQHVILRVLTLVLLHLSVIVKVESVAAERARRPPPVPYLILTGFLSAFETPLFELFPEESFTRVFLYRARKVPILVLSVATRSSGNRGERAKVGSER